MKQKLKCKTPAKAKVNFRKHERIEMNRKLRQLWNLENKYTALVGR